MQNRFNDVFESIILEAKSRRKKRSVSKSKVVDKSTKDRKDRAKNVKIKNLKSKKIRGGEAVRHTYVASSSEKSESKSHKCRIDILNKTGNIIDMDCSCSDYQSRYKYHRNKSGVSRWNHDIKPVKDVFNPHTKEAPEKMNKNNDGYACKHILAFVDKKD